MESALLFLIVLSAILLSVTSIVFSITAYNKVDNLSVSSSSSFVFDKTILPTQNNAFNIGSAQYRVSETYLGSSLVLGDAAQLQYYSNSYHFQYQGIDGNGNTYGPVYSLTTFQDLIPGAQGPQGPQGIQGIQGNQGVQGIKGDTGDQGIQGPQGAAGPALTILGNYPNSQTFCSTGPGSTTGALGISWLMEDDGSLYLWGSASTWCNGWYDAGDIQGPQGAQGIQGPQGPQGIQGIQGVPGGSFGGSYGSFYSSVTQFMGGFTTASGSVSHTPLRYNAVAFKSADVLCSTSLITNQGQASGDSRIYLQTAGVYTLNYSIQLDDLQNSNQAVKANMWLRINGQNVADSGSVQSVIGKDGEAIPFCEYINAFNSGDYFEIVWFSTNSNVVAASFQTTSIDPSVTVNVPSVITNVYRIA